MQNAASLNFNPSSWKVKMALIELLGELAVDEDCFTRFPLPLTNCVSPSRHFTHRRLRSLVMQMRALSRALIRMLCGHHFNCSVMCIRS
jgi:hypothetical protein